MNIDRHNYEMYFLLYVDNELSAEERTAVENFIAENADLKSELELLLSTTLPAEDIGYTQKQSLYKNEPAPDLLQEKMLLHLDNELEPLSVASLEESFKTNDALRREWNILQQTKLDANEQFVFKHKELLYRQSTGRVVAMRYWKVAIAAALIIGFGIYLGLSTYSANKSLENTAATKKVNQPSNKIAQPRQANDPAGNPGNKEQHSENLASRSDIIVPVTDNGTQDQKHKENPVFASQKHNNKQPDKSNIVTPVTPDNKEENVIAKKQTNHLPTPYFENINNKKSNETVPLAVQDNMKGLQHNNEDLKANDKIIAQAKVNDLSAPVIDNNLTETDNAYARHAVLDENDSEGSNNHILFVNEEKINRSKISGLFKKVKRVLTRNANIKTGTGIKIAGFEIAAK